MATSQPKSPARKLRWFQYSLRSLFLLTLVVSLVMGWVAPRMKRTRQEDEAVEEIKKLHGQVQYDYEVRQSGNPPLDEEPPGPAWLRNLLGENFFATVVKVHFDYDAASVTDRDLEPLKGLTQLQWVDLRGTQVTDAGLEYLKGLKQLQALDLFGTHVTDSGLQRLRGLTQLSSLHLVRTHVTDEGVERLQRALPKCRIRR